ncbi:MAG TPA: type II secretion system F family protein [Magnetospirillaceae bacterium]|jgi:general secretion pathway protein F
MDAASREEVIARLQAAGAIPIRATEAGYHRLSQFLTADIAFRRKPSTAVVAGFIAQLSALLRAGLPLDRVLEILHEVAGRDDEAKLAARLLNEIQRGRSLGDAMTGESMFSRLCVSMVRAGEASGTLDAALARLAGFLAHAEEMKAKLRSALLYPIIVLIACGISLAVLFAFVIPRFRPFFAAAKTHLPPMTRILLNVSEVVEHHWLHGLIAIVAMLVTGLALLRDKSRRRRWDAWVLRLPLFGELIRKTEIGQWSDVLGTLLKNGVPLEGALTIAGETMRNSALITAAVSVARAVVEGAGLSEPLRRAGVFPPLVLRLVRVGEEAARLDDMLLELGAIYARETDRQRERLVTLIGPALTIGMGLIVAVVMGSIVTAILGVYRLAI